jgi:hypothetical protein
LNDAGKKAEDIEKVISTLSETIQHAQITEGFSDVLDSEQLDVVYCAAIRLSTAVTEYLAKAIVYFEDKDLSKHLPCVYQSNHLF